MIEENFNSIQQKLSQLKHQPIIIGASKKQPTEVLREAISAGVSHFGENYVQEALTKKEELQNFNDVRWHLIGPLQRKKIRKIIGQFFLIHTIEEFSIAEEISRRSLDQGIRQDILVQINIGSEQSKAGVTEQAASKLVESLQSLQGVRLKGLMAMPPLASDPEVARPYFVQMRNLFEKLKANVGEPDVFCELSMGTSHDFFVAAQEGATMVRIGEALLGRRPK